MSRIPEATVEEILGKIDPVAIIGERVRLVRKGSRWLGLCPFHGERTPSFSVDAGKGLFYCFGCHKGGTVVDFLMELDKLTFREVMEELAQKVGVKIPEQSGQDPGEDKERSSLLELYDRLARTFHWFLVSRPEGETAREILARRGISLSTTEAFSLGYAPAEPAWLFGFLMSKGYSEEYLLRSGLFGGKTGRYPIFTDRIIFPIRDYRGRTIAFGGRLIHGDGPKYLNSPETILFKKQECLFAIDKAIASMKERKQALVCEGYMDALSFHAAGLTQAVAPLGTAFTQGQAKLLKRWCEKVLLCFDSDSAGQNAAEKSCAIATAEGLDIQVVLAGSSKDASEILEKEGPGALQNLMDSTINGGDFLIRRARERFDITTAEGKSKATEFLFPYIGALGSEVGRSSFMDFAARELGVNPVSIQEDYVRGLRTRTRRHQYKEENAQRANPEVQRSNQPRTGEALFFAALALVPDRFPGLCSLIEEAGVTDPRAQEIVDCLSSISREGIASFDSVLRSIPEGETRRFLLSIVSSGELEGNPNRVVDDGIFSLRRRILLRRRDQLLSRLALKSSGAPTSSPAEGFFDEEDMAGLSETDLLAGIKDLDAEIRQLDARNPVMKGEGR